MVSFITNLANKSTFRFLDVLLWWKLVVEDISWISGVGVNSLPLATSSIVIESSYWSEATTYRKKSSSSISSSSSLGKIGLFMVYRHLVLFIFCHNHLFMPL